MWLLGQCAGAMWDGMGGLNAAGFQEVMRLYQVPERMHRAMLEKLLIYKAESSKRKQDGEQ